MPVPLRTDFDADALRVMARTTKGLVTAGCLPSADAHRSRSA